jgi:AraC-like DNA-binding protein
MFFSVRLGTVLLSREEVIKGETGISYIKAMPLEQYQKIYLYRRIVQAKIFIDNHYAEKIDLKNIADEAHFSKFHFIRLFKDIYGKTPRHYLTEVRIDKAKSLLAANHSVSDACFSVGFDSVTSFTGLFKKLVGYTPSAFQLQQQQRKAEIKQRPLHFIPNCFAETYGWVKNSNSEEAFL